MLPLRPANDLRASEQTSDHVRFWGIRFDNKPRFTALTDRPSPWLF